MRGQEYYFYFILIFYFLPARGRVRDWVVGKSCFKTNSILTKPSRGDRLKMLFWGHMWVKSVIPMFDSVGMHYCAAPRQLGAGHAAPKSFTICT